MFLSCSLAFPLLAADAPAPSLLDGNWTWVQTNCDGYAYSLQFKLRQKDNAVTGSVVFPRSAETPLLEGKIAGDQVEFKVKRQPQEGAAIGYTFAGTLNPGSLKGTVTIDSGGTPTMMPWEAKRAIIPANSTWASVLTLPDNTEQRWRFRLRQQDDAIVGRATTDGHSVDLRQGRIEQGMVSFEASSEKAHTNQLWRFRGKVAGYGIKGEAVTRLEGREQTMAWVASRPEPTIEGTWEWVGTARKLKLELQNQTLSGHLLTEDGKEHDLANTSVNGQEYGFEAERERDGQQVIYRFRVRLVEDTLTGTLERVSNGQAQPSPWEGHKLE